MQYTIIGKYIMGSSITGFDIQGKEGKVINVTYENACSLAKENKITGYKLVEFKNEKWLHSLTGIKMSDIPTKHNAPEFHIIEKITKNNLTVGFIVEDSTGKQFKFSNNKVWELSKNGYIDGVITYIDQEKKIKLIEEA